MSSSVKKSGAACGPTSTAISHCSVRCGISALDITAAAPAGGCSPRCRTSPVCSARPLWPPNSPRVNVARLPRYSGNVDAAAHREVGAAAGAAHRSQLDDAARGHQRRAEAFERRAVQRRAHVGAGQRHDGRAAEAQARTGQRALEAGGRRGLPTRRLASRNDSASIGPDGGTPTCQ